MSEMLNTPHITHFFNPINMVYAAIVKNQNTLGGRIRIHNLSNLVPNLLDPFRCATRRAWQTDWQFWQSPCGISVIGE
jgi:hypothetical protein